MLKYKNNPITIKCPITSQIPIYDFKPKSC